MIRSEAETTKCQLERRDKEIEIIEKVASQINKHLDSKMIANTMLTSMDEHFDFKHSMILMVDEKKDVLRVIATHGYKDKGVGAEVKFGVGVIGIVAKKEVNADGQHRHTKALHGGYKKTGSAKKYQ